MMLRLIEKRCVVSMRIGESYDTLADLTFPRMQEYASKIWADFHVIDSQTLIPNAKKWQHICWEKYQLAELFDEYAAVAFIDVDCWIASDCPDIFAKHHGGFVAEKVPAGDYFKITAKHCGLDQAEYEINSGVMVIRRSHRGLTNKPHVFPPPLHLILSEQHWWAINAQLQGLPAEQLSGRFHRSNINEPFWIFHAVMTKTDKLEQLKLASRR